MLHWIPRQNYETLAEENQAPPEPPNGTLHWNGASPYTSMECSIQWKVCARNNFAKIL